MAHASTDDKARRNLLPGVSDEDLWEARRLCDSAVHPDTGEIVPKLFRLTAFVPSAVIISAGMLMSPVTIGYRV